MSATATDEIVSGAPGHVGPVPAALACDAAFCTAALPESAEPVLPEAQRRWAARSVVDRLEPIRKARHWIAAHPEAFAQAISPALARTQADTLITELLPLLEAMRFLERRAIRILASRSLGRAGRPLWLAGVAAEIHREPLGHILVIGPANFPLFLPGVQVLQALVAGNAVTWKPGTGGERIARLLSKVLREAGLPRGILHVTEDSVAASQQALAQHPDKVVFTGSVTAGRQILHTLAETATPSVMELSGADAVVVLPSADLGAAAKAIAFGLRLNGAEVCMSPRRVVGTHETLRALCPLLTRALADLGPVRLNARTATLVRMLVADALAHGAEISGGEAPDTGGDFHPVVITGATPSMAITQTDLFAPVISLLEAPTVLHLPEVVNHNPYGLTAAIFGDAREARALAVQLRAGTVLINDLIAPTADPRMPFGGRGQSGFGLTRGSEGLLELTATKTVLLRRKVMTRHYDPLGPGDLPLFSGLIGALHGQGLGPRWRALQSVIRAARSRKA